MTEDLNVSRHGRDSSMGTFLSGILLIIMGVFLLMNRAGVIEINLGRVAAFLILAAGGFEAIMAFAASTGDTHLGNRWRLLLGLSILFGRNASRAGHIQFHPGRLEPNMAFSASHTRVSISHVVFL